MRQFMARKDGVSISRTQIVRPKQPNQKRKAPRVSPRGFISFQACLLEAGVLVVCMEHRLVSFQRLGNYKTT